MFQGEHDVVFFFIGIARSLLVRTTLVKLFLHLHRLLLSGFQCSHLNGEVGQVVVLRVEEVGEDSTFFQRLGIFRVDAVEAVALESGRTALTGGDYDVQ